MNITKEDVLKVAKLGKLNLDENEVEKFTKNLGAIVGFAETINQIDVSDVAPTAAILPLNNVFRKDEVQESMDRDKLLANAPEKKYGCFHVKNKIVD